jgi:hypothetical protein
MTLSYHKCLQPATTRRAPRRGANIKSQISNFKSQILAAREMADFKSQINVKVFVAII